MTDSPRKFELKSYFPCQLSTLTQSIMRSVASLFDDRYGISLPEWKVLAVIRENTNLSAVSVASLAQMDTVAVSRAVTKLLDRGLVFREIDSEDRRCSVLQVSEEGRDMHDQISPLAYELEANLLADLSEEERRVLAKAIRVLRAKAKVFTDAYSTPTRRLHTHVASSNGQAQPHQFRPVRPGPLVFGTPVNGITKKPY